MVFANRIEAGKLLAQSLLSIKEKDPIILGLPRGGVPVAYEVAHALNKPLDVIIVRKLGVPWQNELAFGAIGEGDQIFLNQHIIKTLEINQETQDHIISREREEIKNRQIRFRGDRKPIDIKGRCVVIVDDGIATGATVEVACKVAKARGASEIIVAAPVAAQRTVKKLANVSDKIIVLDSPENFESVGEWYEDFSPTLDEDVIQILTKVGEFIGH